MWQRAVKHEFDMLKTTFKLCPDSDKALFQQFEYLKDTGTNQRTLELFQKLLLGLRWRFQLQERYVVTFNELLRDGLLREDAIMQPINSGEINDDVEWVETLLTAFDNGAVCGINAASYKELTGKLGYGNFHMPLR